VLPLPRRERRILEYFVNNKGRRITKSQIFQSIYGIFDENVDENVVESHISKLRKKLKHRLGFDPIDSKRYLWLLPRKNAILGGLSKSAGERRRTMAGVMAARMVRLGKRGPRARGRPSGPSETRRQSAS